MSYLVTATFDIADGDSEDYAAVYEGFAKLGLKRQVVSSSNNSITLPTTTTCGEFNGASAGSLRDDLCARTKAVFADNKLRGEIFIAVGGDWAWGHREA